MNEEFTQEVYIRKLGPIKEATIPVKKFTILTGKQASGKSTIAKAIYFFRSFKSDVFDQITYRPTDDDYNDGLGKGLKKRARKRFLEIFGSSWSMDSDMRMKYSYSDRMYIEVYLEPDHNASYRNFVKFNLGEKLQELLEKYENHPYAWDDENRREALRREISEVFSDEYQPVYIPAGRSMATVLSDQLAALMDENARSMDYCTRMYIRLILSKRPFFRKGIDGLYQEKIQTTQDRVDKARLKLLEQKIERVLQAKYIYDSGEERLEFQEGQTHRYVKINFASSGQQEAVWVFNLLYYYLLENEKVFFILEEPEAHLYPDAQKCITEALGLFGQKTNHVLLTTHSPYILGELNNLYFAGSFPKEYQSQLPIPAEEVLDRDETWVAHVNEGKVEKGIEGDFIKNELIDGASIDINDEMDQLIDLEWEMKNQDGKRD